MQRLLALPREAPRIRVYLGQPTRAEGEAIGTSYICTHPSDFAVALYCGQTFGDGAERWCFRCGGKIPLTKRASGARDMTPTMLKRTNAPYRRISSLPAIACLPPPESYITPASLCRPPCNPIRTPMLMQSASAKMILRPVEADAGLEVCISAFEPCLLPALARYYRRSDSPVRLGSFYVAHPIRSIQRQ
jgi:hypothetical protein